MMAAEMVAAGFYSSDPVMREIAKHPELALEALK